MDNRVLEIILRAKDEATKVIKQAGGQIDIYSKKNQKLAQEAVIPLGAAFAATTGILVSSVKAYEESQDATAQLNAVLKSTAGAAGLTSSELRKMSVQLQQQSRYSDEAVLGAENILLTFTKIGKNTFPQATQAVLDMSTALHQDLQSSAIQLGKALQDPIVGVTALRRVGVNFNEDQQKLIKTMVESGHQLQAQQYILHELGVEFGGSAKAGVQTFAGQLELLKNNLNDTQEIIGQGIIGSLIQMAGGMDRVNAAVLAVNQFLMQHKDLVLAIVVALISLTVVMGGLFLAALIVTAGAVGALVAAIGLAVAGVAILAAVIAFHWTAITAFVTAKLNEIKQAIDEAVTAIGAKFGLVPDQARRVFDVVVSVVKEALKAIASAVASFNPIIRIGLDLPDVIGAFNSLKASAHKIGIPGFASGTDYAPGGLAVVGERGPELVNLPRGSQVFTNQESRTMGGGGPVMQIDQLIVRDSSDIDSLSHRFAFAYKTRGDL